MYLQVFFFCSAVLVLFGNSGRFYPQIRLDYNVFIERIGIRYCRSDYLDNCALRNIQVRFPNNSIWHFDLTSPINKNNRFNNRFDFRRRFVWNFFRLENEHLNNCGKFRAVRDICIAPIAPSDPLEVIRMMDEEDGVTNRSRRRPLPAYLKKNNARDDKKPIMQEDMSNMDVNLCM